jgi:mannose-6-phosphate isomerase-like protein (cupin superfamily)
MTTTHHKTMSLDDAEDMAPKYGMGDTGQTRFLRKDLGAEGIGLANYKVNPGQRTGFGHRHAECEEMYVVIAGSGRFKLDDEIIDVAVRDVVYCPPATMREWEAGPDGLELLAFGHHAEGDGDMQQGWWTD